MIRRPVTILALAALAVVISIIWATDKIVR